MRSMIELALAQTPDTARRPPVLPAPRVPDDAVVTRGERVPDAPRYSVIIACYQSATYINACVDSVLAQSRDDVETIVVDDGSNDAPEQVLGARKEALVLCRQANRGLPGARNTALALARGDWCVLLDADDTLEAGFFAAIDRHLEQGEGDTPDAIAPNSRMVGEHPHAGCLEGDLKNWHEPCPDRLDILAYKVPSIGRSVLRRTTILAIGGYDEDIRWVEDWDMALRMLAAGARFQYCAMAYYGYTQHGRKGAQHRAIRNATWAEQVFRRASTWGVWSVAEQEIVLEHARQSQLSRERCEFVQAIETGNHATFDTYARRPEVVLPQDPSVRLFTRFFLALPCWASRLAFKPLAWTFHKLRVAKEDQQRA